MAIQSDSFQILSNCRALFLRHLGALLQDSRLVSGNAIRAIQEGAGAYFDEMVSANRRGSFAEEAKGLTSSRITLVGEDDMELGIRLDNLSAKLFEATGGGLWPRQPERQAVRGHRRRAVENPSAFRQPAPSPGPAEIRQPGRPQGDQPGIADHVCRGRCRQYRAKAGPA
jgi:hypothetical protein